VTDSDEQRRALRQFVREHHPDRGGDPAIFAEGLRRLQAGRPAAGATNIHVHRRKGPIASLSRSYQRWRHWQRSRRRARPTGRVR